MRGTDVSVKGRSSGGIRSKVTCSGGVLRLGVEDLLGELLQFRRDPGEREPGLRAARGPPPNIATAARPRAAATAAHAHQHAPAHLGTTPEGIRSRFISFTASSRFVAVARRPSPGARRSSSSSSSRCASTSAYRGSVRMSSCVRAGRDDPAALHEHDPVGEVDRRQAVRDDERRASLHHAVERVVDLLLDLDVDRARRVVEDEDRRSVTSSRAIETRWRCPPERS